ncbi:MAG: metal-dependent transcriptional regulator [Candidatus Hadarchaeales archaeon]
MRKRLSQSEEEYLEAIYRETRTGKDAKISKLASSLKVKSPSVVQMINRLSRRGLTSKTKEGVRLTKKGEASAAKIVRRHRLAERLLSDILGCDLPNVHEKACELEHVIDDELAEKLEKVLGAPSCPHGAPIPDREGKTPDIGTIPLSEVGEGKKAIIFRIPEDRLAVQRLLSLCILPGAEVEVQRKSPGGSVIIKVGKTNVALSGDLSRNIEVASPAVWRRFRHRWRWGIRKP